MLSKLHHVAYRCTDAAETTRFYTELLGLRLAASLVQEEVPSIGKRIAHNHIFFEMEDGSFIAFFDLIGDHDPVVPVERDWAQHLALEVSSMERAQSAADRLTGAGVEVVGPVDHHICQSWYFYDPSGHRLEMSVRTDSADMWAEFGREAPASITAWTERKRGYA